MMGNPTSAGDPARISDWILASALVGDGISHKCAQVIRRGMIAVGAWTPGMERERSDLFHGDEGALSRFPLVQIWYAMIITMTKHGPAPERLLAGRGDLDSPAGAHFTECHLTPVGRERAGQLFKAHPEWKSTFPVAWKDRAIRREDKGGRGDE